MGARNGVSVEFGETAEFATIGRNDEMRRIRRKQRYTWMPTLGGIAAAGDSAYGTNFFSGIVQANTGPTGPTDIYITPIVPDQVHEPDGVDEQHSSLRDFTEGQDWLLKRIVGKCFVSTAQISRSAGLGPRDVIVGAGFFVGKADRVNPNIPDGNALQYDPLGVENTRDPWIWRRTWLLGNSLQNGGLHITSSWPPSNVWFGLSVADGPHIDSKVARRIRREERLWFVINAYGYTEITNQDEAPLENTQPVTFALDYRILGAMRRSTNKSTFG